ncbi:MAG TPA: PHP domain-containing protein [Patescibacteria group bacterium]|nr:PHP domain-containing protein [Patescibacteria group bacterium]
MYKADLHVHTTASDGLLSPEEVVKWAAHKKLKAVAITDHDTVKGVQPAIDISEHYNIEVIPGIEFSSEHMDEEIHILGYYIDYEQNWLREKLDEMYQSRYTRAVKMIERLNEIGIDITLEQVKAIAESGTIGRPHIARAMQEKGYIDNMKDAFRTYIGKGGPAYVERYRISCREAIDIIKQLGGVPVLAHPGLINKKECIKEILDMGIEGIEVYHTKHDDEIIRYSLKLAAEYDLLMTGGSDCHGVFLNNEPIMGNVWVDYKYVELLKEKSEKTK